MIAVSDDFKEAQKSISKRILAKIIFGDTEITQSDDLQSLKILNTGAILRSVMRQAEAVYFGNHTLVGQSVQLAIGVELQKKINKGTFTVTIASPAVVTKATHGLVTGDQIRFTTTGALPTGLSIGVSFYVIKIDANTFNVASSYENALNDVKVTTSGSQSGVHTLYSLPYGVYEGSEYINYGTFKVVEQETNKGTEGIKVTMFDLMYDANQLWNLEAIYDIVYPCTLLELVQALCDKLGWVLGTTSFPNDDLIIDRDLFTASQLTFRQVLDQIAEATGSIIYFNVDDELTLKQVSASSEESLDKNNLKALKVEPVYGPVTSVVLSRQPQNDDIVQNSPS